MNSSCHLELPESWSWMPSFLSLAGKEENNCREHFRFEKTTSLPICIPLFIPRCKERRKLSPWGAKRDVALWRLGVLHLSDSLLPCPRLSGEHTPASACVLILLLTSMLEFGALTFKCFWIDTACFVHFTHIRGMIDQYKSFLIYSEECYWTFNWAASNC